jgi:hypothetical protein
MCLIGQVPDAMDYLLAEFNRVCIYTVPKHMHALNVSLYSMNSIIYLEFIYLFFNLNECHKKNLNKL